MCHLWDVQAEVCSKILFQFNLRNCQNANTVKLVIIQYKITSWIFFFQLAFHHIFKTIQYKQLFLTSLPSKMCFIKVNTCYKGTDLENEWMNEWMKHLYSALLCIVVHPKCFTIMWGVSLQPASTCIHLDDVTAATAQRRQCAHHTPATGGEEREPIK